MHSCLHPESQNQELAGLLMIQLRDEALMRHNSKKKPEHWKFYKLLTNLNTKTIELEKMAYSRLSSVVRN